MNLKEFPERIIGEFKSIIDLSLKASQIFKKFNGTCCSKISVT